MRIKVHACVLALASEHCNLDPSVQKVLDRENDASVRWVLDKLVLLLRSKGGST